MHADAVGERRGGAAGVDDQLGRRRADELAAEAAAGGDDGVGRAQVRAGAEIQRGALGQRGGEQLAVARVGDEIAADHRQAAIGAVEADVLGAIGIGDGVAGDELVIGGSAHSAAVGLDQAKRPVDGAGYRYWRQRRYRRAPSSRQTKEVSVSTTSVDPLGKVGFGVSSWTCITVLARGTCLSFHGNSSCCIAQRGNKCDADHIIIHKYGHKLRKTYCAAA